MTLKGHAKLSSFVLDHISEVKFKIGGHLKAAASNFITGRVGRLCIRTKRQSAFVNVMSVSASMNFRFPKLSNAVC